MDYFCQAPLGSLACREATPAEKLELDRGGDAGPTNVIYEGGERLFAPDGSVTPFCP